MLRGYRSILAALAGLAALFWTAAFGAFYGALYAPDRKDYQTEGSQAAGHQDYSGPSESLPDIAGLPGPVERTISNPRPSTGADHEKRDLAAQEASALWAFWMVTISTFSVIVTTIGTIFLYKQIKLTREAVDDTGKATAAMERQNEIAESAQRPWLAIQLISHGRFVLDEKGFNTKIQISVTNVGSSPAYKVQVTHAVLPAHEDQQAREEWAKALAAHPQSEWGEFLVPQQASPQELVLTVPREEMKFWDIAGRTAFSPSVIIIATYSAVGRPASFQTALGYLLCGAREGGATVLWADEVSAGTQQCTIMSHPGMSSII